MSKTILLTGGAGFIGHHTVEHILKTTDMNVVVVDNLNYAGNLNYLADIDILKEKHPEYTNRIQIVYHNIRSAFSDTTIHLMEKQFGRFQYVIHMAAESHVDNSIVNPEPFIMSNVVGTMNVLEMCKRVGTLDKIILVSTDEVYGPSINDHLHKEGEPHRPGNPYSASKAGAEDLAYAYWNTYELPIVISNTMNNFGERQHPEKFLPKTIKALLSNEPVIAHCKIIDGKVVDISSRCWLHARNHADGLLFLLQNGIPGERYNITGKLMNVRDLIQVVGGILDVTPTIQYEDFHSFRRGHDMHYGLDGTKMKELGWEPKISFISSLEKTVLWFKENKHWLKM